MVFKWEQKFRRSPFWIPIASRIVAAAVTLCNDTKAKVRDHNMMIVGYEYVDLEHIQRLTVPGILPEATYRTQISMHNSFSVEIRHAFDNFCDLGKG